VTLPRRLIAVDSRAWGVSIACLCVVVVVVLACAAGALAAPPAKRPPAPVSPTSGTAAQSAVGSPATRPTLSARAAILIEESTGQVLYASNAETELAIASTTKLMTALLTVEHEPRLSAMFTAPNYYAAAGDSQIRLVPGERMSVHDLLLALLIPSADDAAEDLAYNVGGRSVARFVGMMNARARELGLTHTHYSTPSGLDTAGNYSSATDLVKLSMYLVEHHPWLKHVVSLPHALLRTGSHRRYVVSTDTLLSEIPWFNGIKTGHTAAAGYVLVGSGTRGGVTLVSAVLGAGSQAARDSNTLALLGYGFSNFGLEHPVVPGTVVARPTVSNSPGVRVPVFAAGGVSEVVARNARLTTRVDVPTQLAGPLRDHAVVGSVVVSDGRRVVARVPVELSRALPAISELTIIGRFLTRTTTLVLLVLLIGGASVLARRRWGGRRAEGTAEESHVAVPAAVVERAAVADEAPAAEQAAVAERAAAVERELRRAEREARRRAGTSDPTPTSARDSR
jgi:D-alanyl-D-alanine carboxypeptidase (penicillin-binding protein 5/6)